MPPTDLEQVFKAFPSNNKGRYVSLTELIETTKGHVSLQSGATNKAKFSNLNDLIPGYYQLSPRSKCDSAVSQLIKEMKRHNVTATSVYRMAATSGGANVFSAQITASFLKRAPQIHPDLVRDAMQSFGAAEGSPVTEAQFCNVFDEQFDKAASATVPNSRRSLGGKVRPASAAVPQSTAEARALVGKLDGAMLRQGVSPLAAFTAADLNKNGVITADELRAAVKTLLPDEAFSPADLKMTMLAFDTNRNGMIEQDEFIHVIEDARTAPGVQAAPTLNQDRYEDEEDVPRFERPSTAGSSRVAAAGGLSAAQNLLKILFTDLSEPLHVQNDLSAKNLSLMHRYWGQPSEAGNFGDFEARYCLEKELMTTPAAREVYMLLQDRFQEAVQAALDRIYDACYGSLPSKQSAERFGLLKSMQVDELGMVSANEAATVFAKIHILKDRNLLLAVAGVYQEVFVDEMPSKTVMMMFKSYGFLKSFMVKAESVPVSQYLECKINYLAFATGVWLEDVETLYTQDAFNKDWNEIGYMYLMKLYEMIQPDSSPKVIHEELNK